MTDEFKLYVRDNNYLRQGEIDDYESAKLSPVLNDVGSWSITIDARSPSAAKLANPDWGIVAYRDGVEEPICSGIWTEVRHRRDMDNWTIEIQGLTDEVWLVDRLVSPSPTEGVPPYTVQASDIRSGVASTVIRQYVDVNLGQGAVAARRKANFAVDADPVTGSTVRGEGRWDSDLLAFIQPLAESGGIGFRVRQVDASLKFQAFAVGDKSSIVKYSIDLGNLESYEYSRVRPRANYVYVGSTGSGTSRIVKEFPDSAAIATWERIEGPLASEPSTSDATSLAQAGNDALAQNSEQVSLTFTPVETDTMRYGVHYNLGDKISAQLEGPAPAPYGVDGLITEVVRKVDISLDKDKAPSVTPTLGTPAADGISRLVRAFQRANVRINKLERS